MHNIVYSTLINAVIASTITGTFFGTFNKSPFSSTPVTKDCSKGARSMILFVFNAAKHI